MGVLALVAVVAVQGRRQDPAPAPAPATFPSIAASPPQTSVVAVAVGGRWAYALVSVCDTRIVHECDYRVHRRALSTAGWQPLDMHVSGRTTTGLDFALRATADDRVALIERNGRVVFSPDGGTTTRTGHLRRGPPVAGMPAGTILADGLCDGCDEQVTALDPATGEVRSLATQPALAGFGLRLARAAGAVLWVAQLGPTSAGTAVSRDGGRSWRTVPVGGGLLPETGPTVLATGADGAAYLVGRRNDAPRPDVRRIDGPDGTWRRLTTPTGPVAPYSAVVDERGLLVGDFDGKVWRLRSDGAFVELPGTPGYLAGGAGGVLAGLPSAPGVVQLSYDGGLTWRVEQVAR